MQVSTSIDFTEKSAIFSQCKKYRYTLTRKWSGGSGIANFLMLNPSTADELMEDPTIRRCCIYAKDWGYSGVVITNLFAYRATNPSDMKKYPSPVGPDNDFHISEVAKNSNITIAAWGTHGSHLNRARDVERVLSNIPLFCLEKTSNGSPKHPLYLRKDIVPVLFGSVDIPH